MILESSIHASNLDAGYLNFPTSILCLMALPGRFQIVQAQTAEDFATARTLFTAYAESLGIDLTFQSFESELQNLAC